MSDIVLTTLNARYSHSAMGLRCLLANMGELEPRTTIQEFVIDQRPIDLVEKLLANHPKIIGLGVYIWNVSQCVEVVALLKQIAPKVCVVLGGPEVSYEWENQDIVTLADHVICGPADLAFAELCRKILRGESPEKIIQSEFSHPKEINMPYRFYNDNDIANRVIYVEASRGCPFKCEFCLSSLDKTAWPFPLEAFLDEMDRLHQRGVRHFKFVDRTFNLKIESSIRIMEFFLQRMSDELFLHFELIPDHLPESLKEVIQRFPPGHIQFEIGIQTFNPDVQTLISRRQDNEKSVENIRWLREKTDAHLHTDLIIGLPGENLESIAQGFNRLVELNPHEIQVGILKRLRGSPIRRHTEEFQLRFNPHPPYNILATRDIDFPTMQRLNRFARYWDMIGNSGRFSVALPILLGSNPFDQFMQFSDWLFDTSAQTHKIALRRLFELLHQGMIEELGLVESEVIEALNADFIRSGLKGRLLLKSVKDYQNAGSSETLSRSGQAGSRQARHGNTRKNQTGKI